MAPPSRCGACKYMSKNCEPNCFLAPYFPANEPQKFINVHKVYGSVTITRILQSLPESHRAAAANSLSYDAEMRLRDPIHGCMGPIMALQKKRDELKAELAAAKQELAGLAGLQLGPSSHEDDCNRTEK